MSREFSRQERVADQVRKDLSVLIQQELRDPRLGMISVTAVRVSRDLAHARVFFTSLDYDSEDAAAPATQVLNKAAGFLRSALARGNTMRSVPRLRFQFDNSVGRGRSMEALISQAKEADRQLHDGAENAAASSDHFSDLSSDHSTTTPGDV